MRSATIALLLAACGPVAGRLAAVESDAQTPLIEAYRAQSLECVRTSTTREQGEACFASVDQAWAPVWEARRAFAEVYAAYVTGHASAEDVTRAWCTVIPLARKVTTIAPSTIGGCP